MVTCGLQNYLTHVIYLPACSQLPQLVNVAVLLSHYMIQVYILQVKGMPHSVTKRSGHSMNVITVSPSCLWLVVMGGHPADSNLVLLELSKWPKQTPKEYM